MSARVMVCICSSVAACLCVIWPIAVSLSCMFTVFARFSVFIKVRVLYACASWTAMSPVSVCTIMGVHLQRSLACLRVFWAIAVHFACSQCLRAFLSLSKVRVLHACACTVVCLASNTWRQVYVPHAHTFHLACLQICPRIIYTSRLCVCFLSYRLCERLLYMFSLTAAVAFDTVLAIGMCCLQVLQRRL